MIHDSTEWYSPCEFTHGKLDKAYILKDRLNRKVICSPIKVVGISSYLTKHFHERGLPAARIPVIMDVENTRVSDVTTSEKVRLIYAGSPAKKDLLREVVLGISGLTSKEQNRIELHVYGASIEQLKTAASVEAVPDCIKAYGRVPRSEVEHAMLESDFSILLRPAEERYTKAGFPTKSVEAMSHGVAMICNLTSDLGMYLEDGVNAVIARSHDEESFGAAIRRVLALDRKGINQIKKNARATAEKNFDYRKWVPALKRLIEG